VNKEGDFGCRPPGVPQVSLTANAQQFLQPPGYLLIVYEGIHSARMIPMDGRPHAPDLEPTFLGDSVGRYEGDVAVIDTVSIRAGMSDAGGHHMQSENAHYVERYRRTGATTMSFELTIEDPSSPFPYLPGLQFDFTLRPAKEHFELISKESGTHRT